MMSFNGELLEIFSWLPANDIYKLSTVCMSSNQLLFDDFFIRKQFKNMQLFGDTYFFIQSYFDNRFGDRILDLHAVCPSTSSTPILPDQSLDFVLNRGSILASSNGLICCKTTRNNDNSLFLFNPTTRSYLPIPLPDENMEPDYGTYVVFECDEAEDSVDYLLMILYYPPEWAALPQCKIYSPEERIWKDRGSINLGPRILLFEFSVTIDRVVYIISDWHEYLGRGSLYFWPYIVAYDIKKSSTTFLKLPKGVRKGLQESELRIFKWGSSSNSSICLVKLLKNVFTVWVLIRDDVENNITSDSYYWNRVFKMRIEAMGLSYPDHGLSVVGFTVLNGEVLLFATGDGKVYRYNLKDRRKGVEKVCWHRCNDTVCFKSFSSTLRPCGPGAITLNEFWRNLA